jgi:hypothetical protein
MKYISKKTFVFIFSIFFVPSSMIFAMNISIMVIQTAPDAGSSVEGFVRLIEDNVMDVFFDAGYIVSNAHFKHLKKIPAAEISKEIKPEFNEALEGDVEYFVLIIIGYKDVDQDGETKPETIFFRLYRVAGNSFITEEKLAIGNMPYEEALKKVKAASGKLIPFMRRRP